MKRINHAHDAKLRIATAKHFLNKSFARIVRAYAKAELEIIKAAGVAFTEKELERFDDDFSGKGWESKIMHRVRGRLNYLYRKAGKR